MANSTDQWRDCKFCHVRVHWSQLIQYEVRHYAHATCLLKAHGPAIFPTLKLFPLMSRSLHLAAEQAGCLAELEQAIADEKVRVESSLRRRIQTECQEP